LPVTGDISTPCQTLPSCPIGDERTADECPAFLVEACAGDDTLRREVESLLAYRKPKTSSRSRRGPRRSGVRRPGSATLMLARTACTAYTECMQYTIRGVPAAVDSVLRDRALSAGK